MHLYSYWRGPYKDHSCQVWWKSCLQLRRRYHLKQLLFGANQLATFSRMSVLNIQKRERNTTISKRIVFLNSKEIFTLNVKYDFAHYSWHRTLFLTSYTIPDIVHYSWHRTLFLTSYTIPDIVHYSWHRTLFMTVWISKRELKNVQLNFDVKSKI